MANDTKGRPTGRTPSDMGQHIKRQYSGSSGGPGNAGVPESTRGADVTVLQRRFVPPETALEFHLQDERDTFAVEAVNFVGAGATFIVPERHSAIVRSVQFIATMADASMQDFNFQLTLDGSPVPGLNAVQIFQAGGVFWTELNTWVKATQNQGYGASFRNALGGAHHVGFIAHGWFWPEAGGTD